MSTRTCTFRTCDAPATRRVKGVWDTVWFYGCPVHIDDMIEATYYGNTKIVVETL